MYPYKLWLQRPPTIQKSVSQKSQNRLLFYQKEFSQKIDIHTGVQVNIVGVAPFLQGEI